MNFEFFMAKKHLIKRRHSGFVSFNFAISIIGVGVGVMALIVVLAVMSGFDRELKSKIIGAQPHIIVEQAGGIQNAEESKRKIEALQIPGIRSMAPFVQGQSIIKSDFGARGIIVRGVDLASENVEYFQEHMWTGNLDFREVDVTDQNWLGQDTVQTMGRIVLGRELAQALSVHMGDIVSVISPSMSKKTMIAALRKPKHSLFVVGGIYHLGMSDFDSSLALISLEQGQAIYELDSRVTGLSIRVSEVEKADTYKWKIAQGLDASYVLRSWMDLNRNFFAALRTEKTVMTILLSLIVLVAAFNIVSSLTMVVKEKTKDIGILRAIGATAGQVSRIFLLEGFIIGISGVALGAFFGLLLAFRINAVADFIEQLTGYAVFPSDVYYFDQIPVQVNGHDVWVIVAAALVMSLVAGLYPAIQAARLKPVEAIRYE